MAKPQADTTATGRPVNGGRCWPDRLARWWVRAYTRGVVPEARDRRRKEIASDLWEQQEEARANGEPPSITARRLLARILVGVPGDLSWRMEMRELEWWGRRIDRELAGQQQHDVIAPLAFVLQALRPRVEGWSESRSGAGGTEGARDAAEITFGVPSLPPEFGEWLAHDGKAFVEGFPLAGSEADASAYDDALRSASVRLNTTCPRRSWRGHRFSRRSRSLAEARLRDVGLDVRGPDGGGER